MTDKKEKKSKPWSQVWRDLVPGRKANVAVERNIFRRAVDVYAVYNKDGSHHFLTPEGIVSEEEGTVQPQDGSVALIELWEEEAQDLFQELWNTGYRPEDMGKSQEGQVAAMQNHIDDLRQMLDGVTDMIGFKDLEKLAVLFHVKPGEEGP